MINVYKLKGRLKELNMTQEDVAKKLEINVSTFNKKINDEKGEYLTIEEASMLKNILKIQLSDINSYFFKEQLEDNQEKY